MRVRSFRSEPSPLVSGHVRVTGRMEYDDGHEPEELWFDVPAGLGDPLAGAGNACLAALALLPMKLAEPLRLDQPVDADLYANIMEMSQVLPCWHPQLSPLRLEADLGAADTGAAASEASAAFFSGGADGFFTVLRPRPDPISTACPIRDLIYVWGFDLPLRCVPEFERLRRHLEAAAVEMDKRLLVVATNLRQTRVGREIDWGRIHHGGALAGVAHLLNIGWRRVYIGSSHTYRDLYPWGSHPLTDPLHSTRRTRILHDGADTRRTDKVALLAQSPAARKHLHVCWRAESDRNCGRCGKCYRTMAALDALGCLDDFVSFDRSHYNHSVLGRLYVPPDCRLFLEEIIELALRQHRPDLVDCMRRSLRRSSAMVFIRQHLDIIGRLPACRGWSRWLDHRLLQTMVR